VSPKNGLIVDNIQLVVEEKNAPFFIKTAAEAIGGHWILH
jgi:hypothetical protein